MKWVRAVAVVALAGIILAAVFVEFVAPSGFEEQFRDEIDAPPSLRFPLGTDELGRDRLARLLHGTRISLLFAPAAAAVAVLMAAVLAFTAGASHGVPAAAFESATDLVAALPWLFLLITVRAALPLDAPAAQTVAVTYGLLALIGWAAPARVLRNAVRGIARDEYLLQARAFGTARLRLAAVHMTPNLLPLLAAQMLVAIPVFVMGEANLGLLGLGVPEPMPSLGGLLRELESCPAVFERPWVLAPVAVLGVVVGGMQVLSSEIGKRTTS